MRMHDVCWFFFFIVFIFSSIRTGSWCSSSHSSRSQVIETYACLLLLDAEVRDNKFHVLFPLKMNDPNN